MTERFDAGFKALAGNSPFPWQRALFQQLVRGDIPPVCDIPTGLGKTLVIAIWLLARAAGAPLPRRLVYVVNRRTVVDQTTVEVERIREHLASAGIDEPLAISTLRGQLADNRAWSEDPSRPAVICGTVDMIGSRLLFSGYRCGFKGRPLHAGFLGQDALLIHDEAHLEPAFQQLLETIVEEQRRCDDRWPLRVMALTATSRTPQGGFQLGADDHAHPVVEKRIKATKRLSLHPHGDRDLVEKVVAKVREYVESGRAVLVFLRTVEAVSNAVAQLKKMGIQTQQLTGTMRGYERDGLVTRDPVFRRFLPGGTSTVEPSAGTVALVCTSAGEVGVNLSADHLVCDLSTFDAMAQRFGRVNRFGDRTDSEVHVFHPLPEELEDDDAVTLARRRTLDLLHRLRGDASPAAIAALDAEDRRNAFAPPPQILPATEILLDAWAMTTIRDLLSGRPPVSEYLHGVEPWEPPTTQVAWRDEVDRLSDRWLVLPDSEEPIGDDLVQRTRHIGDPVHPRDLLEDYPLKPHELLADRTGRVVETLISAGQRDKALLAAPIWIVGEQGGVDVVRLGELLRHDRKRIEDRLARRTILLSPRYSRPVGGLLVVEGWGVGAPNDVDVADQWLDERGQPRRARVLDADSPPPGMRLIRTIGLRDEPEDGDDGASTATPRSWSWYECPRGADDEGSRSGTRPVLLDVHSSDVERIAREIVDRLRLPPGIGRAVVMAAKHHDHGKNRRVWQRSIGNTDRSRLLAKSGGAMRPMELTAYRHELGSVLDAERTLLSELEPDERDLALHLIAAHHGRARPHFPEEELFDPEARGIDVRAEGLRIMQRFARLQRRFGRWGLAYLESVVRAADYAASAAPSQVEEMKR